jgi:hypothetical protein
MTADTERSLGMAIAILGVVVFGVAVVVLDGTEAWLLASSAVLFLVCGAGLLANAPVAAPTRARRVGRLEYLVDRRQARPAVGEGRTVC